MPNIVPGVFNWVPDKEFKKNVKPTTTIYQNSGSVFNSRDNIGINNLNISFDVSFSNRSLEVGSSIIDFLEDRGGAESFYFIPPWNTQIYLVTCSEWESTYTSEFSMSITAKFEVVYDILSVDLVVLEIDDVLVTTSINNGVNLVINPSCDPYWDKVVILLKANLTYKLSNMTTGEYQSGTPLYQPTRELACTVLTPIAYPNGYLGNESYYGEPYYTVEGEPSSFCTIYAVNNGIAEVVSSVTYNIDITDAFRDEKNHTIDSIGSAEVVPGGRFDYCLAPGNSSGNSLLCTSDDLIFGADDCTLEAWVFVTDYVGDKRLLLDDSTGAWFCQIDSGSGKISSRHAGGGYAGGIGDSVPLNRWFFLQMSRANGIMYASIDGIVVWSDTYTEAFNNPTLVLINSQSPNWRVDEFRLTVGIARNTSDFEIPTEEFSTLSCQACTSTSIVGNAIVGCAIVDRV